ncbi:MAG: hypothetical protein NVSMB48_27480 [Marmoricola sp.]
MTARYRRASLLVTLVAAMAWCLVGCGSSPAGDFSRVRALVAALERGHVGPANSTSSRQYRAIIRAVGGTPSVTLVSVSAGSAQVRWSWPVPGGPWTYLTRVPLVEHPSGVWSPQWSPSVVVDGMRDASRLVVSHPRGRRAALLLADGRAVGSLRLGGLAASIERSQDATLGGVPGTTITLLTPGQAPVELASYRPGNGRALRLTINRTWQLKAQRILDQVSAAATLIAIRPSTGAIVAVAGSTQADSADLATSAHAAAGSTWKTVDSLALIRVRHFTPDSIVACPRHYTLLGFTFKNDIYYPASGLGNVPLKTAVANSCNTAMLGQHAHLTYGEIRSAAETLGLTIDHDLGFPAFFGKISPPANEFVKAEDMIGQGDVLVSPLAMATDIATIQHGATVVPWMIPGHRPTPSGSVKPLSVHEDAFLKTIFHEVVVRGTASGLLGLPGGPIIAKTGTAEFIQNGHDLNHTWMIAAQGDLAVCVYFDIGNFGADTSGPVLRQFLAAIGPH